MQTSARPHAGVSASLAVAPVVGVVRTSDAAEAHRQARAFIAGGLELVEITFTVPGATDLVRALLAERVADGPPWIGMGTVTHGERARAAVAAGAEFLVSPNPSAAVVQAGRDAGLFTIIGALTPGEIVTASELGADLVKVFPLPPVGGAQYLATVRGPLGDIPMLASGGYGVEEIPDYRRAGAIAFGIGAPLLAADAQATRERIGRALLLARGEEAS
jgi:2-dehydro-3-deoxyphosphogluconate aldolase/(4S)-4-hydroxy-2-oxoglutarate aldolase